MADRFATLGWAPITVLESQTSKVRIYRLKSGFLARVLLFI